jgi:hypothetical protein
MVPHVSWCILWTLQYDKSGRSTGEAIIAYETTAEATKAKQQLNGVKAKGDLICVIQWMIRII